MLNRIRAKIMGLIAAATATTIHFSFPKRQVMTSFLMASLPDSVVILTEDGNSIVISTAAARLLQKRLPESIAAAIQAKAKKAAELN